MVFWQRTQRQNVLMIFPYGLKKKNTFMSIANDDCKNKQSCIHFFGSIIFLRIFLKRNFVIVKKISLLQAKFSEALNTIKF